MAKISMESGKDGLNRDCFIMRKRGRINDKEAYEFLENNGFRGEKFVHIVECPQDDVLEELYDDVDTWLLYRPEDILPELVNKANENVDLNFTLTHD